MFQRIADWLTYSLLKLSPESGLGQGLNFFFYDSMKILALLFFMISIIGFFRTYLAPQKVKKWLQARGLFGSLFASLFGAVTPFCSCSSIPIFFGLMATGVPLGVSFSFLITSPLINEYLVVLMLGFFGWKITLAYVGSGIVIGTAVGTLLGKMKLEKHIEKDLILSDDGEDEFNTGGIQKRIAFGIGEALSIIQKLWLWILIGVGIGALIHNYVPQETVQSMTSKAGFWSVPIAVLIGVPMYGSCAAIVPIAVVLFEKGVSLGTALAFMMAVSALSLPEAVLLKRAMRFPLIVIFFGITAAGIILTGYLFNFLQIPLTR